MTLQTRTAAAAANGRAKPLLANTAIFWSVMTTVVALTLMLTGWTAVQAQAVEDTINGNGPAYPSIRQLERQAEEKGTTTDHLSIRQAERQAAMTAPQPPPLTVRQGERQAQQWNERMAQLEAAEHKRFTNRVAVAESVEFAGVTDDDLERLERQEERRFRNRLAPTPRSHGKASPEGPGSPLVDPDTGRRVPRPRITATAPARVPSQCPRQRGPSTDAHAVRASCPSGGSRRRRR